MTTNETFVLMLALIADQRLRYRTVYKAVHGEQAWSILNKLHKQCAIDHVRYDYWQITEKGRIAIALAMSKDKGLAGLSWRSWINEKKHPLPLDHRCDLRHLCDFSEREFVMPQAMTDATILEANRRLS